MSLIKNIILSFCAMTATAVMAQNVTYLDESRSIDERVEDILGRMTLEEKIALIHAQSKFCSPGIPRLGVPELWCTDGPHGIRPEVKWDEWDQAGWTNDSVVAFPALTCLAATWNTDLAYLYGRSIGEEARYRKKDVLLGPGLNIYRTPLGGRNFEYMGEDPYLTGQMAVGYVRGVQSNGVATCVKHFCLNNQEWNRHGVNVHADDRAFYEIYLPAFKAALMEGGSWSVMASYNKIDGQHAGHNYRTLVEILKKEWGYKGAVVSDWGGTHNTDEAVRNGLDLEFGTGTNGLYGGSKNTYDGYHLALPFLEGIRSGKYPVELLDDKVRRVLRLHLHTTLNTHKPFGSLLSPEHYAAARKIGEEGIVLLKNEGNLLPLRLDNSEKRTEKRKTILVVGENAVKMMTVGGGSSSLKVQRETTPLEGLHQRLDSVADVKWVRGYVGDIGGSYNGVTTGQDLRESRPFRELVDEAVNEARNADYVIYIGGLNKSYGQDNEGTDRKSYELPYKQDSLIAELAKANDNLVVVNISGNAVAMPWVNSVRAIVLDWYLGSEAGAPLAAVLAGDVNPSGKLPFSWPVALNDVPAHRLNAYTNGDEEYKESIFVGYRWYDDEANPTALFPFGHGLSYTTFSYSKPRLSRKNISASDSLTISVDIKNTGSVAGKEAVQLYISDVESSLPRPVKELKGFRKVSLAPGETKTISFTIGRDALSYFNPAKHDWVAEPGKFEAIIASSSRDIRGTARFELKK